MEEKIATGRRKTAVSSIRLRQGNGKIDVNGLKFEDYFPLKIQQEAVLAPYHLLENKVDYDMIIRVKGGGKQGQVDATRLALARALAKDNEKIHSLFKDKGYLTRDPRKRERKKYGRAGARKRFQFSKR